MTNIVSEIEAVEDEPALPGSVLRAGRQQLGLSREAVADKLHLTPEQISALEADDYRQFAAPIFIAGYIRSYARLLDIPIAPLLAMLKSQQIAAPSLQPELGMAPVPWHRNHHAGWAVMLAAGGLLLLLLVWLLSDREALPPLVPSTTSLPNSSPQTSRDAGGDVTIEGAPVVPAPEPARSAEQPVAARTSLPAAPAAPAAMPVQPSPSLDHLRLRFTGDSWVEISDADGRRLFFNLGKQGEIKELQGKAPFSILLGNAPAVQIEYNGKPYNHQPYNRKNVARFSLGGPKGPLPLKE